MKKFGRAAIFAVTFAAGAVGVAWAECESYDGLRLRVLQGDVYCGDSGPGCTECYNYNQGGYSGSCIFMASTGAMVCTDGSGRIYYAN